MVAFAEGLVTDPKQAPMLHGLTESMLKSQFRGTARVHVCSVNRNYSTLYMTYNNVMLYIYVI